MTPDRGAPNPGVRTYQPSWARLTGIAVWLWAGFAPAVGALAELGPGPLAWVGVWVGLVVGAWFGVRPATELDLRGRRILGSAPVRVRDAVGWGRSAREGWVRVETDAGVRTIATDPDEAEAVYAALRAWGATTATATTIDGFTLGVEGRWTPNGLGSSLPMAGLAAATLLGVQVLSILADPWGTALGSTAGTLGLLLTASLGIAGGLALLVASWGLTRLASGTTSCEVSVRGTRMEVRRGLEVSTLELRAPLQLTLYATPVGSELIVRSAAGSLVVPGMTRDLTALRDALAAVRPTEGTEADLPPELTRMQHAREAGDLRRVAPGGRAGS